MLQRTHKYFLYMIRHDMIRYDTTRTCSSACNTIQYRMIICNRIGPSRINAGLLCKRNSMCSTCDYGDNRPLQYEDLQQIYLQCLYLSTRLHGVKSQNTSILSILYNYTYTCLEYVWRMDISVLL